MKKLFLAICSLAVAVSLHAEYSAVYTKAPETARKALSHADELIAAGAYQEALDALDDESDFTIAKKVEISTLRLVQTAAPYNPETAAAAFAEKHGMTPPLHYALGMYYYDMLLRGEGSRPETELVKLAEQHLKAAIDAGCYDTDALQNYAALLLDTNRLEAAAGAYRTASEVDPGNPDPFYNYAVCLMRQGKYTDALAPAERAAVLYGAGNELQMNAVLLQADAYSFQSKYAEAEQLLKKAQKNYPGAARPQFSLGELYAQMRNLKLAAKHFQAAYDADSTDIDMLRRIVRLYFRIGKPQLALSFCNDNIKTYGSDSTVAGYLYLYKGGLEAELGNKDGALASYDKADASFASAGRGEMQDTVRDLKTELEKEEPPLSR